MEIKKDDLGEFILISNHKDLGKIINNILYLSQDIVVKLLTDLKKGIPFKLYYNPDDEDAKVKYQLNCKPSEFVEITYYSYEEALLKFPLLRFTELKQT